MTSRLCVGDSPMQLPASAAEQFLCGPTTAEEVHEDAHLRQVLTWNFKRPGSEQSTTCASDRDDNATRLDAPASPLFLPTTTRKEEIEEVPFHDHELFRTSDICRSATDYRNLKPKPQNASSLATRLSNRTTNVGNKEVLIRGRLSEQTGSLLESQCSRRKRNSILAPTCSSSVSISNKSRLGAAARPLKPVSNNQSIIPAVEDPSLTSFNTTANVKSGIVKKPARHVEPTNCEQPQATEVSAALSPRLRAHETRSNAANGKNSKLKSTDHVSKMATPPIPAAPFSRLSSAVAVDVDQGTLQSGSKAMHNLRLQQPMNTTSKKLNLPGGVSPTRGLLLKTEIADSSMSPRTLDATMFSMKLSPNYRQSLPDEDPLDPVWQWLSTRLPSIFSLNNFDIFANCKIEGGIRCGTDKARSSKSIQEP